MGQSLWQILPTNPPDNYNCPYSATSAFANHPLLISLDLLLQDKLLHNNDLASCPSFRDHQVQFNEVKEWKSQLLTKAAKTFLINNVPTNENYKTFCKMNKYWLDEFALFTVLQKIQNGSDWIDWENPYKSRVQSYLDDIRSKYESDLEEVKVLQYLFHKQWLKLKSYAKLKAVQIIGDIPIYVSFNSADVWANQHLFKLTKEGNMTVQSGCPPDFFIETGQIWGHPIYDWDRHEKSGYKWWVDRLAHLFELVDIIRIDHFNGFAKYWEVSAEEENGINGKWVQGPGEKLFNAIVEEIGSKPILAEDLGEASKDAALLRNIFSIPGMKILQMSFSNGNPFEKMDPNNVVYTGTHDNDTSIGWYYAQPGNGNTQSVIEFHQERKNAKKILKSNGKDVNWKMVEFTLNANANTSIIIMQDVLGLDSSARMNTPGTVGGNWEWRMVPGMLTKEIKKHLKELTKKSNRL
jgi:4-alpha-glucanotransferase